MPFNKEMDGRVAIITGAGRSIGRSMALELADAGCAVVVNVRTNRAEGEGVVKEIEKMGGRAMVAVADVIDPKAVNAMAEAAPASPIPRINRTAYSPRRQRKRSGRSDAFARSVLGRMPRGHVPSRGVATAC